MAGERTDRKVRIGWIQNKVARTRQHALIDNNAALEQGSITRHHRVFVYQKDVSWQQLRRVDNLMKGKFRRRVETSSHPLLRHRLPGS